MRNAWRDVIHHITPVPDGWIAPLALMNPSAGDMGLVWRRAVGPGRRARPREGEQWGGAKRAESDCGSHGAGGAGGVMVRVRLLPPWGEAWLAPGILRAGAGEEMRQSVWPS